MLRVPVPLGLLVFLLLASCCEQLRDKLLYHIAPILYRGLKPVRSINRFSKEIKKRHDYTDYRYTLWLWRLKLHFKMMKYIKIGAGQFFKYCSWTIFATKLISTLRAQLIILKQYDSNYENNFPSVHICQILYELWFLNLIAFSLNNRWLFKKNHRLLQSDR